MRRDFSLGKMLLVLGLVAGSAEARELTIGIDRVGSEAGTLADVVATLRWDEKAGQGELRLQAGRVEISALGFATRAIDWQCPLQRNGEDWHCEGPLSWAGGRAHPLSLRFSPAGLRSELRIGSARLALETRAAVPDALQVVVRQLPVTWLQAVAERAWKQGRWNDGRIDGEIDLLMPAEGPRATAELRFTALALETPDGQIAAAGLSGRVNGEYRGIGGQAQLRADFELRGGEFLVGALYVPLPEAPVTASMRAESTVDGWQLPHFAWRDAETLSLQGSARIDKQGAVQDLGLQLKSGDLAVARDRYFSGFLAPAGFPDLLLIGAVAAELRLRDSQLQRLHVELNQLGAIDPAQRFVLAGMQGDLFWDVEEQGRRSTLGWQSAALYGIGLGAAQLALESRGGEIWLRKPAQISALQGNIRLEQLRWQPPRDGRGTRFQLGVAMNELDLHSLSQRLGWPPFTGSLGGRIPAARYEDGVLTLDGGLAMQLFGGEIALSQLVMERPFGVAPTLSADVGLSGIDLEPLTAAFGFGSITGRLQGRIADLRLVDWTPAAFDARFDTDTQWKGKRRISQRAVEDISSIAGSGLMAGLQAQALKLFDDFGYSRIGIGCRLRDNVCRMEGIGSAGDGYTIVQGSGLPRIQVVGFRRQVDWPTLVARLKAVTEGQRPVFE
ncbi:MAG TPA: hypothetical protein VFY12_06450 [Arenimonas sp.]|nr:hypothetical protein [Arenimonas sp.]